MPLWAFNYNDQSTVDTEPITDDDTIALESISPSLKLSSKSSNNAGTPEIDADPIVDDLLDTFSNEVNEIASLQGIPSLAEDKITIISYNLHARSLEYLVYDE